MPGERSPGIDRVKSAMTTRRFFRRWKAYFAWSAMAVLPGLLYGQAAPVEVPTSSPLSVELLQHVPMKAGEALEGRLLYGIYVDNRIALPGGTILRGKVVKLDADRSRRIHSRFRGDFTPFHIPVVRFDQIVLPDGSVQAVASNSSKDGAQILRLSPPPGTKKRSFFGQQVAEVKRQLKTTVELFIAPGRGDRLVQFIYGQLPYHPERVEAGTAWSVELARPLEVKLGTPVDGADQPFNGGSKQIATAEPGTAQNREEWRLRAYLQQTISSTHQKSGDTFQAVVAEPVFNFEHSLVVPEGSLLVGEVTQAKAARSFGRQGKLRFRFKELKLPSGFSQPVSGTITGIDGSKSANLQMDPEGGVQPQSQNRVIAPLILTLLAGRAFDDDGSQLVNSAVASNGFGIVGRVVGMAASSRNVAGGIGIYGAAVSFYDLWLARGQDVVFAKNTRIEITTTPNHSPLNPSGSRQMATPSR